MTGFIDLEDDIKEQPTLFIDNELEPVKDEKIVPMDMSDKQLDDMMNLEANKITEEEQMVFKQDYSIKPKIKDDIKDKELDDLFNSKKKE